MLQEIIERSAGPVFWRWLVHVIDLADFSNRSVF